MRADGRAWERSDAPFSGSREAATRVAAGPSVTGSAGELAVAGCQVSKSTVSYTRPDPARISNRDPSPEYQARITGPVAGPARDSSMGVLPMCLQSGLFCARKTADSSTVAVRIRVVAVLPTNESIVPLIYRRSGSDTADSSSSSLRKFSGGLLACNLVVD